MRSGAIDGLSIGFRAVAGRRDRRTGVRRLERIDLWEISVVTFPMQPGARVRSVKSRLPGAHSPALRDFERWLTIEAGLSRDEARAVMRDGLKGLDVHTDDTGTQCPRGDLRAQIEEAARLLRKS
jgi:hypothetical protein